MRTFIWAVAMAVVVPSCPAGDVADPFDVLFDTLTIRKASDGSVIAPEADTPRLWQNSRYLIEGKAERDC